MKILVTGAAGFIGSAVTKKLAERGDEVIGIDNLNEYYDIRLKYGRLADNGLQIDDKHNDGISSKYPNLTFKRLALENRVGMEELFKAEKFDKVLNLAAQAGVRYSITNPYDFANSNLMGFVNLLECCRNYEVKHLVFASSSSVYGLCDDTPFKEDTNTDTPISLYAATKKSNELMAHVYSKLYNIPIIGLRYFTVYGPWGRPDMAPMLFTRSILNGNPIKVFNNGNLSRDFTFVDDIAEGTIQAVDHSLKAEICDNEIPYKIFNIGRSEPVKLMDFINELENSLNKKAICNFMPMQPGDVYATYSDTSKLKNEIGYSPKVSLKDGVQKFTQWYLSDLNPTK